MPYLLRALAFLGSFVFAFICDSDFFRYGEEILVAHSAAIILGLFLRRGKDLSMMVLISSYFQENRPCAAEIFRKNLIRNYFEIIIISLPLLILGLNINYELVILIPFVLNVTVCSYFSEYHRGLHQLNRATIFNFFVPIVLAILFMVLAQLKNLTSAIVLYIFFHSVIFLIFVRGRNKINIAQVEPEKDKVSSNFYASQIFNILFIWGFPVCLKIIQYEDVTGLNLAFKLGFGAISVSSVFMYNVLPNIAQKKADYGYINRIKIIWAMVGFLLLILFLPIKPYIPQMTILGQHFNNFIQFFTASLIVVILHPIVQINNICFPKSLITIWSLVISSLLTLLYIMLSVFALEEIIYSKLTSSFFIVIIILFYSFSYVFSYIFRKVSDDKG